MKITKTELMQIIKEEVEKIMEDGHDDKPSAIRKLKTSMEDAHQMLVALEAHQGDLPAWWMSKLTKAADYLNSARDYFLVSGDVMQEGIMDKMLGSKKEELPMSDKIAAVRRMFLNVGDDLDKDDKLNNAMEALDALKLKDEVGEEGSIGKRLWDASSNLYQAFNDLNALLREAEIMALRNEDKEQ